MLPVARRAQSVTCSGRCRTAVCRARQREVPAELVERARWVRRDAAKVPLRADGKGAASSTNASTWSTYRAAVRSTVGVGLGFVLDGDGVVCLDLDHCIEDGRIADWARAIIDACPPTFTEVSQSGHGLHIWGYGEVGKASVIRDGRHIEVYGRGRYIALGVPMKGTPRVLADLSAALAGAI